MTQSQLHLPTARAQETIPSCSNPEMKQKALKLLLSVCLLQEGTFPFKSIRRSCSLPQSWQRYSYIGIKNPHDTFTYFIQNYILDTNPLKAQFNDGIERTSGPGIIIICELGETFHSDEVCPLAGDNTRFVFSHSPGRR